MDNPIEVYDVIVVGAGIEGSSTAYQLAKMGKRTLMLDQVTLPHSRGSSHGQTRITRNMYGPQEFYTHMMGESFRLLQELENEIGTEVLFRNCGCLQIGPPGDEHLSTDALERHNVPHSVLNTEERKRVYPGLAAPDNYGFVLDKSGGVLFAEKILLSYHKRFKELGGTLRDGEQVADVVPGRVVTVKTNKGEYKASTIVLTIGPWAARFLPRLGLNIPLTPLRIVVFYWKEKTQGEFSQYPAFIEAKACGEHDVYALPSVAYPGLVKICLHAGPVIDPDSRDNVSNDWEKEAMKSYIARRFPTLEADPSIMETCIYTNTPDEDFVLDVHPKWKNVVIGAGFSGHGFKLAPVVGKLLAELAVDQKPSYDMTPFRIDRFTKPNM